MPDPAPQLQVGDFLDWPPSRYLADGWFSDAAHTQLNPELRGAYALASAFLLLSQAATSEEARAFAGELQAVARQAPAAGAANQAAINALAERLLQPPFDRKLVFYDFFRECSAFLKGPADWSALAQHAASIAERLALLAALQASDPSNVPPGH